MNGKPERFSKLTLQLYLNEGFEGGSTTFMQDSREDLKRLELNVFQRQEWLSYSVKISITKVALLSRAENMLLEQISCTQTNE